MLNQYILPANSVNLLPNNNKLLLLGKYGGVQVKLPHFYFYIGQTNYISLLFKTRYHFISVLKHIVYLLRYINKIFIVKLKLKGLGYRIKKYCTHLYRFYFTKTNYIYLHVPQYVIIKSRKRRMIIISNHYNILRTLFVHILLLKIAGPYNRRGFVYPRVIMFLKQGKKVA